MKFLFFFLLVTQVAHADCSAPDLTFKKYSGRVHGFKVTKLWDNIESDPKQGPNDTKISYGDYSFLFSPLKNKKIKPKKISLKKTRASKQILSSFKSSKHYLEGEKQSFSLYSIQGIDLNNDSKADVILFEVSPGANVYSGAVGIVNSEWVTLEAPSCY